MNKLGIPSSVLSSLRVGVKPSFAAAALLLAGSSFAGINQFGIGLNLGSDGGNNAGTGSLNPTDVAGLPAVAQGNWNNLAGLSGATANVTDNNGNPTSAGVSWNGLGTWSSGANNLFTSATDHTLMQGYLDNGGTATVTITNIPSQLTTSGYDVYVYAAFDTPNRGGTYQIFDASGSTALTGLLPLNSDATPTNYAQAVGTGSIQTGNYLVFHGLTNPNIQVQAVATNLVGTIRAVISGVQLVASPSAGEPGAATGLVVATNGIAGQLVVSWTSGASSSGSLVVLRQAVPATAEPVDGTVYNANPTFGSGDNLGDDEIGNGNYAVYAGASSSVVVSNLTPSLTYNAAVYSYSGSGASINYRLGNVPTGSGIAPGSPTNIVLALPSPLIAGSARNFQVLAQFANGTSQNVAGSATVTSSNAAIVSILGPGRLGAITSGSVGLTAIYSGFTNIQVVTVGSMAMTYQWSFNEPTANLTVTDSVQQAVGYVTNNPFSGPDGSGKLVLDGSGGYVALPPNILSNYGGLTMETWATETTAATWERLWDFGSGQTINMFMTPNAGGGVLRTSLTVGGGGAEQQVNYGFSPDTARHHYVFTLSGATRTAKIFLDGAQVGVNTNFTLTPEDLGPMPNVYIGKSQYPDPSFSGSYDEFRIYNGPLSATQIAIDAATGPDIITNDPGALTSLTITGGSPIPQFGIEQLSVSGTFVNISGPVNITTFDAIRYFTSDPNIGTVNGTGLFTATGPGTVQIRATLLGSGITNFVSITVNPIPPGMTHRWPFNADFNDLLGGTPAVPHGTVSLDGLGNAVLDGQGAAGNTTGSYIELPANVLLGYSSVALEAWYTDQSGDGTGVNRNWSRLWDFGSGPGNNLFVTPFVAGEVDTMRLSLNINNAGEWTLNCVRPLTNVEHHIVFVLDATNRLATLWVDGQLASYNREFLTRPRDMGPNPQDWLGRSQYGDPLFAGLIDEFRIYNGTIDPLQIGIDYVTGPNSVVQNPGTLSSVSVAVPANMMAGNVEKAAALATFVSVANVPVTALATNWTSSDPTVARVDQNGIVTAIGAGSATISATFRGVTGNSAINVSVATPILSHRYSFDAGDARDTGVVGGGDGTVTGTPTFANGMLTIADVNSYIGLPGHLFDTNLEVTLETWCVVAANSGSGTRLCDFGTSIGGPSFFTIVPTANGNNFVSFRGGYNGTIGVPAIDSWGRAAFGTTNHYAFVVSDVNRRIDFYFNGALKDSFPYDNSVPGTLQSGNVQFRTMLSYLTNNMTEGWFGKNVGGAAGSGWFGSIDEFRIWNGPLNKLQVQVSYLKGPENPSIDPGAIQSLSLALSDTSMVLGSIQRPSVSGTFANVAKSLDLTAFSGVVFTSSDSSKVAVINGGDTKLQAVGVGSANIVASYAGKSVTNTVTVIAKPAAVVTHRYSFRGNVNDSVGHANGALFGNAAISGGKLVLDGTLHPPTYARLPNDLISGYDQLTIEAFYNAPAGASGSQQRLWDFGDHIIASGGITGTAYFYEGAGRGAAGLPMNTPGGGEATATAPTANQSQFTTNVVCVAATIDSPNHILNLYTNGVLAMSVTNIVVDLGLVADNFSLLGRSQWADPHFAGSIDDFRVYYGVLTPTQVAQSFAAGPAPDKLSATVSSPGHVTISWPATLVTVGYSLQSSSSLTSGIWSNLGGVTQVGNNYQVTVNSAGTPVFFRLIK